MGGSSKGQTAPTTSDAIVAQKPAYMAKATPATQPAFLPGQLDFLAKDLHNGFGPSLPEFVAALRQTYQPAQTMNFNAPPPPSPKPKPKTTSPLNMNNNTANGGRNAR